MRGDFPFIKPSISMKRNPMTEEEYRNHVYSKYGSNLGTNDDPLGFLPPDRCYEMINEKREVNHRNRYSRYNHNYRINW